MTRSDMLQLIRPYEKADAEACYRVFFNAVRMGAASHYTEAQRGAWAPSDKMLDTWPAKLDRFITYVAQTDEIIGFMTLGTDGHLDMAYVCPDAMRQGVGKALYWAVLHDPRAAGLTKLTTEASFLARPFFAALGWKTDARQQIERCGILLTNFRMHKILDKQP